jgi:hypothetical protein
MIRDRRRVSGRRRGRICDRLAWRFAIGRRLRRNVSLTEQTGKKRLVGISGEEAREFAAQPFAQALRELGVPSVFQSMENKRAEQHFSPCVVGAFLFSSASLQGLFLCVELGNSFGNAFAGHELFFPEMCRLRQSIDARSTGAKTGSQSAEFVWFNIENSDRQAQPCHFHQNAEFKERFRVLLGLSEAQLLSLESTIKRNKQTISTMRKCTDFLVNYVFSYVKGFDAKRPFEDDRHFYMEREWRVANNVTFGLNDVCRVFFPKKYAAQFRQDLPMYIGQVTFLD